MILRLKTLGLALVAVLAMSVVVASAAHAEEGEKKFEAGKYNAFLTGEQIAGAGHGAELAFNIGVFGQVKCSKVLFDAIMTVATSTVTMAPTYSGCAIGTKPVTTTLNGCEFLFHGSGAVDLTCPAGQSLIIHLYASAAEHKLGNVLCEYTVGPQAGLKEITFTNTTTISPDDVDITFNIKKIAVKRIKGTEPNCGVANPEGIYTGTTTFKAYEDMTHTKQTTLTVK
ncbi:MAG TPA: hypothetical protein VIM28_08580 [Solirubrobacterales bacterium]